MAKKTAAVPAWTDEEIIQHYLHAADRYRIVGILAELNGVSAARIKSILRAAGIEPAKKVPKRDAEKNRGKFEKGCSVSLEREGKRYTMKQVATLHHRGYSFIQRKCFGDVRECDVDGTIYKVIHRRSG